MRNPHGCRISPSPEPPVDWRDYEYARESVVRYAAETGFRIVQKSAPLRYEGLRSHDSGSNPRSAVLPARIPDLEGSSQCVLCQRNLKL
jgi:hypothetical protein